MQVGGHLAVGHLETDRTLALAKGGFGAISLLEQLPLSWSF